MKRSYFQIEGDTISSTYCTLEKEREHLTFKKKTFFTCLPMEILNVIVIYLDADAYSLQQFTRFLFIEFGISPVIHKVGYSEIKLKLLDILRVRFSIAQPSLFDTCRKMTLNRISFCLDQSKYQYIKISTDTQYISIRAILDAQHTELYTFITYALCECCRNEFSNRNEKVKSEGIPLCDKCDQWCKHENLFKDNVVDYARLKATPILQYLWLNEAKFRKLCSVPRKTPLTIFLASRRVRQRTVYKTKGPQRYFLLKDTLPFIASKFKKNVCLLK